MEARENDFGFMEQEHLIKIPFFQRAYVWEKDQWEQLFEDLRDSYETRREHFLGSIVLKQILSNAGEGSIRSLIDGQQRLTTFSILVKSLYDKLDSDDRQDYVKYLFKSPTKEKKPKIQHSKLDKESFDEVLGAMDISSIDPSKKDRIVECYRYFSGKIEELEEYKKFLNFILKSKLWVTINLSEGEDEQKIFDSINTAGLKLTATDIIKNAIFAKAIDLNFDYENFYVKYWELVFESKGNREFWEKEVSTGRLKRVQSEILLYAFAIIEGFFDYNRDTLENLSDIYKKQIKDFNAEQLENFLKKIKEYAVIYKGFPNITNEIPLSFGNREQRLFHILRITDTNTIVPLILALKLKIQNKVEILHSCFDLLETFIIMRWICSESTKAYNKIFADIAQNLDEKNPVEFLKKKLNFVFQKENIEKYLVSRDEDNLLENKKATLILFWIELYRRYKNNKKQDIIELSYNFTLEHLMPQSWEENWKNVVKDELNAKELIYQIGNMTLLKGGLNSAIKNASWKIKLEGDGSRKNCIKACGDLLITKELFEKKEWNEDSIKERTKQLIQDFFRIWDIEQFQ